MGKVADRSDYFAAYYEVNKEKLAEKRRNRYQNDPEYRERIKEAARERRRRAREEREQLKVEGRLPPPKYKGGIGNPATVLLGDKMVPAYSITILADRVGKPLYVVQYWARRGLLPQTPFRSNSGSRLYTQQMINAVKRAVNRRDKISTKDDSFRLEIKAAWRSLGIAVA